MDNKKSRGIAKELDSVTKTVISIKGAHYVNLPIWFCRKYEIVAGDKLILIPGKVLKIVPLEKEEG